MTGRAIILLLCGGFTGLGGCAGSGAGAGGDGLLPQGYALSAEEKALDCRRLTGRIQVRLLALRGETYKIQPSAAAQSMRSATSAALGTDTAKNAAVRTATDRPVLEAYNARLVELGCPSFDLGKELEARPSAPTPYPTIPARKAS
ncbi:MAG: hypothetical protein C0519_05915 [Hyphomicrobium sp.]|nr:hypothetical protein [Hyphomicrobium sp.]PPD07546.1 MAG: hypothetical protein CTY28_08685 [Hyphomicrobium sp.]